MRNIKMIMPKMQLNSKFVNNMLPEWGRFMTTVKLNRGLKTSNYDQLYAYLKQHEAYANENKMMLERYNPHVIDPLAFVSNISSQQYPTQSSAIPQSAYVPSITHQPQFADNTQLDSENGVVLDEEQLLFIAGRQPNTFDDDVDVAPIQDLALNEDNVFQADQCDAFDFDVDEAPTAQTMFMASLSSADPIYDEASPSYDSDILSEVQDHDNYIDSVGEYHEVQKIQNDVQPNYVVDSDVEYTSASNIILYEQYVKDNPLQVVKSNVSYVPNDALIMIINDMHEQSAECVSANEQNKVVYESLTAELARCKEQVELYEKRERKNASVTMLAVKPKVLASGMYAIDVEPILPRHMNNSDVHLEYLTHLKESVETVREIAE
uniref:Integrase, catalytic region, zinc finger, CCHC-type, peptidase aspartic, catalytic n=1 Tax=Tanacetum cinerariifolium TaxID=118510 RepID=A0A699HQQ0_TANCI|nr:integrase, catalytic region, zinc finger, CCHC-type, peptidase aspartic, catalytic [Tanacetum cinerariifolium]GEY60782.1 integrase, catalytic region, zinc finger, CCHC-type, peptidase aspartic, catalytic [Tanacetum cinerariifolium]